MLRSRRFFSFARCLTISISLALELSGAEFLVSETAKSLGCVEESAFLLFRTVLHRELFASFGALWRDVPALGTAGDGAGDKWVAVIDRTGVEQSSRIPHQSRYVCEAPSSDRSKKSSRYERASSTAATSRSAATLRFLNENSCLNTHHATKDLGCVEEAAFLLFRTVLHHKPFAAFGALWRDVPDIGNRLWCWW